MGNNLSRIIADNCVLSDNELQFKTWLFKHCQTIRSLLPTHENKQVLATCLLLRRIALSAGNGSATVTPWSMFPYCYEQNLFFVDKYRFVAEVNS